LEEKTIGSTLLFLMAEETTLDPARNSNISPRLELDSEAKAEKPWVKINNTTRRLFCLVAIFNMGMRGVKLFSMI
jgi:hypothetical protein